MQSDDNQTFENITITESRNQKKKSLFKHVQARNPLVVQAEKVARRHQNDAELTAKLNKDLGGGDFGYKLDGIEITQKRKILIDKNKVTVEPAEFEAKCTTHQANILQARSVPQKYAQPGPNDDLYEEVSGPDILDNRVPKCLKDIENRRNQETAQQQKQSVQKLKSDSIQTSKTDSKKKTAISRDLLDQLQALRQVGGVPEQLLRQILQLNENRSYYLTGSCECPCHKQKQPPVICFRCFCASHPEKAAKEKVVTHSCNLLDDVPLPIYRTEPQSSVLEANNLTLKLVLEQNAR